ncbi:hypothetical protein GCM10010149_68480 [Nonomuraea roseoviolacea subsp. roseoviolacea]|uniref:hypothetical protein n=1 Tax=Nonomuraea roseoviolacea TaxID=103837 RepID=UPI0031E1ECCE
MQPCRNTSSGAALETALITAIIADRAGMPVQEAVRLAEQDRWDDRVQFASKQANQLISRASLCLQAVAR